MTARSPLSGRSVTVPPHVHVREVADELVILSLESEEYFGLDAVGARMWQLLSTEPTIQQAFETLLGEYDVDAPTLARDLEDLVERLRSSRLLELAEPQASQ